MIKDDKKITRVLFLLRSYNDIDHIVPIIWKCRQCKVDCYYLLVESDHSRDYRIGFIKKSGAIRIHSKVMNYYHSYVRHFLISDSVKNIFDRLAGYMIGRPLLRKNKIESCGNGMVWSVGSRKSQIYTQTSISARFASL